MPDNEFSLPKSQLLLQGTRLIKKNKKGEIAADHDITRFERTVLISKVDYVGIVIAAGLFGITFVCFRSMSAGIWRWVAVIVLGAAGFICLLVAKRHIIQIVTDSETLDYQLLDLYDDGQSFVAMLNQRRKQNG